MCRSELMIPKLKVLVADERFEVKFATLGEYLAKAEGGRRTAEVRRYGLDDVWHGLTLGKNGDCMRQLSAQAEREILNAEAIAAMAGIFGRPYAQWDVYPVWELEEAWRELLAAQHHDNDECEGLCGRIGKLQYQRSFSIAKATIKRSLKSLGLDRDPRSWKSVFNANPFCWRAIGRDGRRSVPACSISSGMSLPTGQTVDEKRQLMTPSRREDRIDFRVNLKNGLVEHLAVRGMEPVVTAERPLGQLYIADTPLVPVSGYGQNMDEHDAWVNCRLGEEDEAWGMFIRRSDPHDGIDVNVSNIDGLLPLIKPGFAGALKMMFPQPSAGCRVVSDSPYAVQQVVTGSKGRRKYPEGDWMTSTQWFEDVEGAFTSSSLVDMVDPETGNGLLIVHKGSMQWFLGEGEIACVLAANDPWDEGYFLSSRTDLDHLDEWDFDAWFRLIPHGPISNAERWKTAQEYRRGWEFL